MRQRQLPRSVPAPLGYSPPRRRRLHSKRDGCISMLRYWSSLRYSSLRTLFLLADELRRQPPCRVSISQSTGLASWEYPALSLLSNVLYTQDCVAAEVEAAAGLLLEGPTAAIVRKLEADIRARAAELGMPLPTGISSAPGFGYVVTEPPPVSLRLPSGSLLIPQTGAPDGARLDACSSHQHVCVPLDAAVTPCNVCCTVGYEWVL